MAKEKVTLTLDASTLEALRGLVGRRSLSASVDQALQAYVERQQHLRAVDEWIAEMDETHGPIPAETLRWAEEIVESWERDVEGTAGVADAAAG